MIWLENRTGGETTGDGAGTAAATSLAWQKCPFAQPSRGPQSDVGSNWIERRFRTAGWLAPLAIGGAALIAYHNSLNAPYVFDDESSILANGTIHGLWPIGPPLTPPNTGTTVSGRPFLNLTLAINYAIGRLDSFGYHALGGPTQSPCPYGRP